jgi:drug/metabolite transporter (DMT)-like permease
VDADPVGERPDRRSVSSGAFDVRLHFTRLDGLLLLMTFFWGSNFTVIKAALRELPGPAFNGLRMILAAVVFLGLMARQEPLHRSIGRVPRRDWPAIVGLAVVGHGFYQYLFLGGVARTSVANSSLIFGCTPITVGLLSAWVGHERPGWARWAGTILSLAGIYFVVGHRTGAGHASLTGDLMIVGAMLSWAVYTVGAKPLLARYSPFFVTGLTMSLGTLVYAPLALLWLRGVDLTAVTPAAWAGLLYSSLFSLVAAYVIWYTAVQRVGGSHTAIYSNVVPIVAITVAAFVLQEPVTASTMVGAAAVILGVAVTRLERPPIPAPVES